MPVLADTAAGDASVPYAGLVSYGALGAIFILGILGYVYFKPSVNDLKAERDRALAERDKADAQRDAMAHTFQTQLLPVLTKFLTTTEALLPVLQRLVERTGEDRK